jgi:hypothetical protein
MLIAHAIIPRYGLGNCLFPWARAEIFAHRTGARMLRPCWFKPKVGPYIRREPDKRAYWTLFQGSDYLSGIEWYRARWLLSSHRERAEWYNERSESPSDGLCIFTGMTRPDAAPKHFFKGIAGNEAFLLTRFLRMARRETYVSVFDPDPYIAIHLRRGDLALSLKGRHPANVPDGWYADALRVVRTLPELRDVKVKLITDTESHEVEALRRVDGVQVVDFGNAVGNLMALAGACLLIGTGYSTYSQWAAFFGGMPVIYSPNYIPPSCRPGINDQYEGQLGKAVPRKLADDLSCRALLLSSRLQRP